jgi:hypothetical protein
MCIVELNGDLFWKCLPIGIVASEAPNEIGHRAGYEKVLLHKTQPLPHVGGVVGIKNSGEGFGLERLRHSSDGVPVTERRKVEVIRCVRSPEAKRIDGLAAVTDYWPIKENVDQRRRTANDRMQPSPAHLTDGYLGYRFRDS